MKVYFMDEKGRYTDRNGTPSKERVYVDLGEMAAKKGLPSELGLVGAATELLDIYYSGIKFGYEIDPSEVADFVAGTDADGLYNNVWTAAEVADQLRAAIAADDRPEIRRIVHRVSIKRMLMGVRRYPSPMVITNAVVNCPQCGDENNLVNVEPDSVGNARVEFACGSCNAENVATITVSLSVERSKVRDSESYKNGRDDYENDKRPQSGDMEYLIGYEDAARERGRCLNGKYTSRIIDAYPQCEMVE